MRAHATRTATAGVVRHGIVFTGAHTADDATEEATEARRRLAKRYGWRRVPLAIWRCGWRRCASAGPVSRRPCPGEPGGGITTTASASAKEQGTSLTFGEVGLVLELLELESEGEGEGVR